SKAEITFNDGSIVRMGNTSQVRVKDYVVDNDGFRKSAVLDLERGNIRAIVSEAFDKAPFTIMTPNSFGSVKGSDIFVSFEYSATSVLVSEGVFNMTNPSFPGQAVDVPEGMTSLVPYNAPPEAPRAFLPLEKDKRVDTTSPVLALVQVPADSKVTTAIVTRIAGTVRVQPKGSGTWHAPIKNEVLTTDDRIETGETGRIQINFDNGLSLDILPNTNLVIKELKRDPKTGDFENLFDSDYGRIIAKLENKPEDSKFSIKTPHAVCGIRGTIMYLYADENCTWLFFEGGAGFMIPVIEGGNPRELREGWTGKQCRAVGYSEHPTTEGERSGFNSEWGNEGTNEYGYTGPLGDPGYALAPLGARGGGPDAPGSPDNPFDKIKPEPDLIPLDEAPTTITSTNFFGRFAQCAPCMYLDLFNSDISGTFTAGASLAPWTGGPFASMLESSFENPRARNLFYGEFVGSGDAGGSVFGVMVGAGSGGDAWVNGSTWQGVVAALYIDPLQSAGVMYDDNMTGTHTPGLSGDINGTGSVTYTLLTNATATPWADLFPLSLRKDVGEGDIFIAPVGCPSPAPLGEHCLAMTNIVDEAWGIWNGCFSGVNQCCVPGTLTDVDMAVAGLKTAYRPYAYLGAIQGMDLTSEGFIEADFDGIWVWTDSGDITWRVLSDHLVGNNEFIDALGLGTQTSWEALGAGEWVEVDELLKLDLELADIVSRVEDVMAAFTGVINPVISQSGAASGLNNITGANMDMSLYCVNNVNIWAALFDGTYDTASVPTTGNWDAKFAGVLPAEIVKLTGGTWAGGEWFADVSGTVGGNTVDGTAAGTYAGGDFEGAGAGTWQ
ncbi:MAG: FecR domain-containing protein, partial [Candidatus Omnitrophica bacterium]|nr:FecR domain-containing protein [Candidatus Omnitrophota bacterium]